MIAPLKSQFQEPWLARQYLFWHCCCNDVIVGDKARDTSQLQQVISPHPFFYSCYGSQEVQMERVGEWWWVACQWVNAAVVASHWQQLGWLFGLSVFCMSVLIEPTQFSCYRTENKETQKSVSDLEFVFWTTTQPFRLHFVPSTVNNENIFLFSFPSHSNE